MNKDNLLKNKDLRKLDLSLSLEIKKYVTKNLPFKTCKTMKEK